MKKKKEAYKLVLQDLRRQSSCSDKDYCIGCYGCGIRLVYKTLQSHYNWLFNSKKRNGILDGKTIKTTAKL